MPDFTVDFQGKSALITGAGSGIGEALAHAFAQAGAAVVVNDLNPDRAEKVAAAIRQRGGQAIGIQADVSNRFQAAALIERARDAYGRIAFLLNAAGMFRAEPLQGIDEWDWRRQIEINLTGTFFCTQLMSRVMSDEGGGVILNFASTVGLTRTLPTGAAYSSSKAGIIALSKQAARELAPDNIRVNVLCPGYIAEPDMPQDDAPQNALQRLGTPQEVADVALFLCSDAGRFITGQAIVVDGGG